MGLESGAQFISDLNPAWPLETDFVRESNEHLQLIKQVLQNSFINATYPIDFASIGGAWGGITGTLSDQTDLQGELDALQADIDLRAPLAGPTFTGIAAFQGEIRIPDGDASAPGLKFLLDQDTGIYRDGANTIKIATAAQQRFEMDTSLASFNLPLAVDRTVSPTFSLRENGTQRVVFSYDTTNNELEIRALENGSDILIDFSTSGSVKFTNSLAITRMEITLSQIITTNAFFCQNTQDTVLTGGSGSITASGGGSFSKSLSVGDTLVIQPSTDHAFTPSGTRGQLWVNTSGDLIFTKGDDTDTNLLAGGGGSNITNLGETDVALANTFDFTGWPADVQGFRITFRDLVHNNQDMTIRLRTGSVVTSGYDSHVTKVSSAGARTFSVNTGQFEIDSGNFNYQLRGYVQGTLMDAATDLWSIEGQLYDEDNDDTIYIYGELDLASNLQGLRLQSAAVGNFTSGFFSIQYWT